MMMYLIFVEDVDLFEINSQKLSKFCGMIYFSSGEVSKSTDVKNTDTDLKENISVHKFPFEPDDSQGKGDKTLVGSNVTVLVIATKYKKNLMPTKW